MVRHGKGISGTVLGRDLPVIQMGPALWNIKGGMGMDEARPKEEGPLAGGLALNVADGPVSHPG